MRATALIAGVALLACGRATPDASAPLTVLIEPLEAGVSPGGIVQFTATVQNAVNATVRWTLPNGFLGSIDQTGRYQAPSSPGTYTVTAVSEEDPRVTAAARVTIYDDLRDNGGSVVPSTRTYAIWWGGAGGFASDSRAAIEAFLSNVGGSQFLAIVNQYLRGAKAESHFAASLEDASPPPTALSSFSDDEVCAVLDANHLAPEPDAIYFVYTSTFPASQAAYLAWHDWAACHGTTILVAHVPNPVSECGSTPLNPQCNALSCAAQTSVNVTAHELLEIITDPYAFSPGAWIDSGAREICDKCQNRFGCVQVGPASYRLQEVYSNAQHACVSG